MIMISIYIYYLIYDTTPIPPCCPRISLATFVILTRLKLQMPLHLQPVMQGPESLKLVTGLHINIVYRGQSYMAHAYSTFRIS